MTFQIVEKIAQCLPLDSAYYRQDPRCRLWMSDSHKLLGARYRLVLNDLSLGWNLAIRYAESGNNLPLAVQRLLPFRAFKYFTSYSSRDQAMARVHALWSSPDQRLFLKSALCARDARLSQIAEWCNTSPEVILLLTRLCFNIRARWDDRAFMTELLRLGGCAAAKSGELESAWEQLTRQELRWARSAARKGIAGLWRISDYPTENASVEAQENLAELWQETSRETLTGVLQGHFSVENNPALELLQTLASMEGKAAVQQAADEDSRRGLGGMSLAMAVGEAAKRISEGDAQSRLTLQTGLQAGAPNDSKISQGAAAEAKTGITIGTDGFPQVLPSANQSLESGRRAEGAT
jgi:hypothetical protein